MKKSMEHEGDVDTNGNWYTWNNRQGIGKVTGRLKNLRISGCYSDNIGLNTEKIPGDLRKLAAT